MADTDPTLAELLASDLTAKKKVKAISERLVSGEIEAAACARSAAGLTDVQRGTVLESLELATRSRKDLVSPETFGILLGHLSDSTLAGPPFCTPRIVAPLQSERNVCEMGGFELSPRPPRLSSHSGAPRGPTGRRDVRRQGPNRRPPALRRGHGPSS